MDDNLVERIRQQIAVGAAQQPTDQQPQAQTEQAPAAPQGPPTTGIGQSLDEVAQGNQEVLKTFGTALVGGARDALQSTWDNANAIAPAVSQFADRNGLNVLGMTPIQDGEKGAQVAPIARADESTGMGVAANVVRDLERFVLGFMGASGVLKGFGVATNTFKGATAAGALGDFVVTGADDKRLSELFDAVPALQGSFLEAISTDGNEDIWKHKLASAAEGMVFGGALEGLFRVAGVVRRSIQAGKQAAAEGGAEAGQAASAKVLEESGEELQTALKEIQAWHGSPHDFDKFEIRPFTGEGSQSFGHGIYVAENKGVAEYYQSAHYANGNLDDDVGYARALLAETGGNKEMAVALLRDLDTTANLPAEKLAVFEKAIREAPPGNLYGVKVKASADEMLDWDGAATAQPANVKEALTKLADGNTKFLDDLANPDMTGEELYRSLSRMLGSDEAASKALLDAGVPGLRFMDQGSRFKAASNPPLEQLKDNVQGLEAELKAAAPERKDNLQQQLDLARQRLQEAEDFSPTRNMVLFDPKSGEVVSKNGQPIPTRPPVEVSPTGQIEMFPEVVRREEAIQDIQLQIKGDRYIDPETGKEKILPISNRAREELTAAAKDPSSPLHIDKLTPETRDELLRALASDNEAARFFNPKTVRGKPFDLDDARRVEFDQALERSLTVPYDTLRAEAPGTAIEDVLSTFFNYRYMDSADTVKVTLDDMANVMRPMVEKHLGGFPQTFERVGELASWIGSKPDTLMAIMSQQARAAEYVPAMVVASKVWVQSLTADIVKISKAISAGTATDTAKLELARRTDILGDLVGTLKAVQTSSARTTAAGRIRTTAEYSSEELATLLKEIGEDNFKFVSRALQLTEGKPAAVIALLEPSWGQKAWGVLNEGWINGLLSGIGTHIVNFVGGTRNTLLYPSFRFVGGALTGDKRSMSVALGQYAGLKDALGGAMEMAWRSLKTENAYVDAAFHQVEREKLWIKADTFGLSGEDPLGKGIDFLGTAIRMPSRFLTASDEFLKQLNYRASVKSRATVEAYERGLKDDVFTDYFVDGVKKPLSQVDEYVRDRMNEAFHPRLENGTDQAALKDARVATFTQPLKEATWYNGPTIGEMAQQAAAKIPPVRHLVLPFTRVPTNVFREMIYESPAAPLRAQFWADIKAGGEARADAVGRLALGSTFWAGTAMLAAEGLITGKGPTDPVLAAQWKLDGKQPYSIKFPGAGPDGKDVWVDYARLGDQWAGMLGIAADAAYVMAHVDERTQDQLALTMTLSLANNLNSRGYLRSLTELSAAISATGSTQGPNAIQRWLNSRASSYVPRVVQSFNPDDTLRDARTMIEAIYAKVPGLSTTLDPKVDNFGVPIAPQVGWPITEINPFKLSLTKPGAARKELAHWADSPVAAQFEIPSSVIDGVMDLRQAKNAETGQSAWNRWMQILTEPKFPGGKTFEEHMDGLASSDGYKELKRAGKEDPIFRRHPAVEFLRAQMGNGYDLAKQLMLQEPGFEELRTALTNYDANKKIVPVGGERIGDPTLDELLKKGK